MKWMVVVALLLAPMTAQAVNKCEIDGRTIYQNAPCPEGAASERWMSREQRQAAEEQEQAVHLTQDLSPIEQLERLAIAEFTANRNTILAPSPGLGGEPRVAERATHARPGDVITIIGLQGIGPGTWYRAYAVRDGEIIGTGWIVQAALQGQPGTNSIIQMSRP